MSVYFLSDIAEFKQPGFFSNLGKKIGLIKDVPEQAKRVIKGRRVKATKAPVAKTVERSIDTASTKRGLGNGKVTMVRGSSAVETPSGMRRSVLTNPNPSEKNPKRTRAILQRGVFGKKDVTTNTQTGVNKTLPRNEGNKPQHVSTKGNPKNKPQTENDILNKQVNAQKEFGEMLNKNFKTYVTGALALGGGKLLIDGYTAHKNAQRPTLNPIIQMGNPNGNANKRNKTK